MTLALEFATQHQNQNLTFAWNLPGIDQLEDPFVVLPSDPEAAYDTVLINDGLRVLADTHTTEVTDAAIHDAMENVTYARDAAMAHVKAGVLDMFPDDFYSRAICEAGWRGMSPEEVASFHDQIASDVFRSATPVLLEGPPAVAARLGLRSLAERGVPDCDPLKLAVTAGEVAAKYSGIQVLGAREADEAYRATVAELDAAHLLGEQGRIRQLRHTLRWIVDHTMFRY